MLHGVQLTAFDHEVNFHLPRPGLILRDDILPALNLKVGYAAAHTPAAQVASGCRNKKAPRVRGLRLPQGLLSRFEVFVLAGQKIQDRKPPKFLLVMQN